MAKETPEKKEDVVKRPPIVVVMGHIDHGKSTLLDYIRKSNVVDGEAGGITQHLSAYVVEHTQKGGNKKEHITFLDTPGHAAFQKMRFRGADVADIAILVVSADEGVMPQTLEALKCINAAKIPYIIAINKIDKPGANVEQTKASLIENEIYIEGMGGDVPYTAISAKSGEGVDELLDILLLTAELAELTGDPNAKAEGVVIEAHLDPKRGTSATLIVTSGTLKNGACIVSGTTYAPVRIMEDYAGHNIREASLSEPVRVIGFSDIPKIGDTFHTVAVKKEAEKEIQEIHKNKKIPAKKVIKSELPIIPILIKADASGTIDAIEHELEKFTSDKVVVQIIDRGVGAVNENDVKNVGATKGAIIVGFNVQIQNSAKELAERLNVEIESFDIIYKLAEWLEEALKARTPKVETEEKTGNAKILKHFSTQKNIQVLGARVLDGNLDVKEQVKIMRRDLEIGRGVIKNLQQQKADTKSVQDGEFGIQIETKTEVAPGDTIEAFKVVVS